MCKELFEMMMMNTYLRVGTALLCHQQPTGTIENPGQFFCRCPPLSLYFKTKLLNLAPHSPYFSIRLLK